MLSTTVQEQDIGEESHETKCLKSRLTVGIAAHNEASNIGILMTQVQSEIGKQDEIVVVASGCTDKTAEIVLQHARADRRIRVILEEQRGGKSLAINKILSEFRGEMLLLVSADVLPVDGSITSMVSTMESDRSIGVVSSQPRPVNGHRGLIGYLGHLYWRLHHETLSLLDATGQNTHGGEAILVRSGIVSSLPIDCINDDAYIGVEAALKGFRVKYCPQALVKTKTPETISELVGQRRRIIAGHLKVKRHTGKYPRVLTIMSVKDPSRFIQVICQELWSRPSSIPKLLAAGYLEGVSGLLAIFDTITRRDHVLWKTAMTTKFLSDK
jgi:cellulose synthase/poly-beta-1,6-N-acetylglucosamine synthase-like glycosyltransferase